jgi:hypothetical protein
MKAAADSKRVLVTVPFDVREWLEERAKYHGGKRRSRPQYARADGAGGRKGSRQRQ